LQGLDCGHGTCLGEVLLGSKSGRDNPEQITVYKAMGTAMEDLVAAQLVYAEAKLRGVGQMVTL
jgi:ornithine cyclodeaminase/alanine dehydrogenase-like protein (mu-crystallin family)